MTTSSVTIHGDCDPRFETIRSVFANNFINDLDDGASLAVTLDGQLVVDLWAGVANIDLGTPWERDALTNVWSSTKNATALSVLALASRGEINLDAPMARYWPEFAAAGKDAVLVRHVMAHSSGLSGWTEPMSNDDLYDWDKATSLLAAQEPWWEPGTASHYHALTRGYLLGELVRRVSGQTIGAFLADELAGPLGAEVHIGLDQSLDSLVAPVIPPTITRDLSILPPESITARTMTNPLMRAEQAWDEAWRRAEIPSANGHANARGMARLLAILACEGEVDGKRFLSAEIANRVFEEQTNGSGSPMMPIRFGIGYGLTSALVPFGPNPRTCFWGGWGGSLVLVDLDARMTIAFMMNRMGQAVVGDARATGAIKEVFKVLRAHEPDRITDPSTM